MPARHPVGRGAAHGLGAGTGRGAWQRSPPHEEIPYLQIRRIAEETPCFNEEDRSTHCLLRIPLVLRPIAD